MEFFYLIPFVIILLIILSMVIQGWMIMNAMHGYSKNPKVKHPEMNDVKQGDTLMSVKFDETSDYNYNELYKRIEKQKMEELFEEPSSYEDEDET